MSAMTSELKKALPASGERAFSRALGLPAGIGEGDSGLPVVRHGAGAPPGMRSPWNSASGSFPAFGMYQVPSSTCIPPPARLSFSHAGDTCSRRASLSLPHLAEAMEQVELHHMARHSNITREGTSLDMAKTDATLALPPVSAEEAQGTFRAVPWNADPLCIHHMNHTA